MSKRLADKEINHDNWNDDEEYEEAGIFKKASADVIKERVIKTAKRRANITDTTTSKSVFKGFSFTKSDMTSDIEKSGSKNLGGLFGNGGAKTSATNESSTKQAFSDTEKKSATTESDGEFYSKLKGLNESVSQWIKDHVDADPVCILTPIFKDYEKYLAEIQEKHDKNIVDEEVIAKKEAITKNVASSPSIFSKDAFNKIPMSSIFGAKTIPDIQSTSKLDNKNTTAKPEESKSNATIFSSGSATFSFGSSSTSPPTTLPTAGFSFGTGAPFTFGSVSNQITSGESVPKINTEDEPENDEPPKVEFKAVIEEGSIYTIRCKVFVKKDSNYVDGGVGNLFLKPVKDTKKTQLIVRADTNLGNLLINVLLSASIPTQRMGKNNVMMVCIPTPEKGPTPVSILLRVKTSEQADELLEMIEKHKC